MDQIIQELKNYLALQKEYALLTLVEKLSLLFSAVIIFLVILLLAVIGSCFLLVALYAWMSPLFGGVLSALILSGAVLCVIALVYCLREYLIKRPVLRFIARLLLTK